MGPNPIRLAKISVIAANTELEALSVNLVLIQVDLVLKHCVPTSHSITMTSTERYSYSPNSPDLAVSTFDGRLIVYDTSLSAVKSEFVPSSHLSSSACTCVAWRPPKETRDTNATGAVDGTPGKR